MSLRLRFVTSRGDTFIIHLLLVRDEEEGSYNNSDREPRHCLYPRQCFIKSSHNKSNLRTGSPSEVTIYNTLTFYLHFYARYASLRV